MRNASTRLTALVATLASLDLALWLVIVPLLPALEQEAGLSKDQAGIVLAAYSASVLLASLPVGHLSDRLGARRMTVAAAFMFAALAPALAFADSFGELVAVRFGQGLFSAVSWTAGLAWLTQSQPVDRRARSLATVNVAAALAPLAGPILGGPVVAAFGLGVTLAAFGAVVLCVAVWALLEPGPGRPPPAASGDAPERTGTPLLAGTRSEPRLRASMVAIGLAASTAGVIQLLAPLHLDDQGFSQSEIGWVFTGTAAASMLVTLTMRRLTDRVDRLRTAIRSLSLVCGVLGLLLLGLPTGVYVAALVALTMAQAPVWVLSYPLCSEGAQRAGVGQGVAMGALNTVWAVGALAAPAAAGLIAEATSDRAAYGVALAVVLGGVALLVQARRQDQRRSASSAGVVTGRRQANRSHT